MESAEPKEVNQKISPAALGYKDRKMVKWQGFILSDHADLVKEKKKQPVEHAAKEPQSLATISNFLHRSFAYGHHIAVQLDFIANGSYEPDIIGMVTGYEQDKIYVQTNEELIVIDLSLIRHVEYLASTKWFNSDQT